MNTQGIAAMRRVLWQNELYEDVMRDLYFMRNGLMGEGENNIIELKKDLIKVRGEKVTFGLTARLSGNGVDGDDELEGNEEAIDSYAEEVAINQKRFGVRLKGQLDEQKNAYPMRDDAKNKLSIRMKEFMERNFFLKLGGVTNTTLSDIDGTVVGAGAAWSNTPDYIPDADENAGQGARYICADHAAGTTSLAGDDLITPALISRARVKASTANPKIQPLRIEGRNWYVMFAHPWQMFDLKQNAIYSQAQRDALPRSPKNPIFTGASGAWDGVLIFEHEFVPFLNVSVAGHSFRGAAVGTDCAVDAFRALLCGKQAGSFAQCQNPNGWKEKSFDYGNKTGFATGLIGGIQKNVFNGKEYGVIAIDTAATPLGITS